MRVTEQMLLAAMNKSIEHGVFSRRQSEDAYLQNMSTLKEILEAAIKTQSFSASAAQSCSKLSGIED